MVLISDWWNCAETRRKINAEQDKRAAEQIKEINRAYQLAKIPGATPRHWLGKISRMNKLGRTMPKGLEHLAGSVIDANTSAFIESGKQAAKAYFASEYAGIRAKSLKRTQKKYANSQLAKLSQAEGGSNSGAARRLKRNNAAIAIVDAYKSATPSASSIKPVARLVADWYIKNFPSNQSRRAMTQMLQRAGVAT
jgi:hypothetical protein